MIARLLLSFLLLGDVNADRAVVGSPKPSRKPGDSSLLTATPAGVLDAKLEPTTFRGLGWGTTEGDLKFMLGSDDSSCHDMTMLRPNERWCESDFAMGDVRATSTFVFVDDKLVQVFLTYNPSEYEFVRSVFLDKYGQPSVTTVVPTRTRAGVEYNNDTTVWEFPNVVIEMQRYGGTIDRGATYLTTKTWIADKKKREVESKKRALDSF